MKNPDKLLKKLSRIYSKIANLYTLGKYDKLLEYFEENENQFKNLPRELRKEAEQLHCEALLLVAIIFSYRGDLSRSLEVVKKILKIAEEIDDEFCLILAMYGYGRHYWLTGDLIQALKYFNRAIEIGPDIDDPLKYIWFISSIMMAVRVAVVKGDLEIAKEYYGQVEMSHLKSPHLKRFYKMTEALILKSSARFRDRAMAEEIFKALFEDENMVLNNRLLSLVDLCELLLVELRITNDINIVDEIKPLIIKLLDFAKIINSFYYFIEANIIQAKLALITFEINNARRFLTQAQRMAERHGYSKLAIEIVDLHKELIKQSEKWDYLKEINAPMSKRMELANLNENLNDLIRVQMSTTVQVSEKEVTVYKERKECLVCLGDIEGFDIYICPKCDSIYCRSCAKALIEIENVCWSCESPIDKAKPVKFLKKEKEKEKIDNKSKKDAK